MNSSVQDLRRWLLLMVLGGGGTYSGYANYYVTTTGNDTTGNGSLATPWKTLVKAIATVPIGGLSRIWVAAGTYAENGSNSGLFIDRTFLAETVITPMPGATVVITGAGASLGSVIFNTGAANLTIDGVGGTLTIQDNGTESLPVWFLTNATTMTNIKFKNLTVTSTVSGASLVSCSSIEIDGLTLDNCTLTTGAGVGNSNGVLLAGKATGWIKNVVLNNCTVNARQTGVKINTAGRVDGLTITNGSYTVSLATGAGIGMFNAAWTGTVNNLTFNAVTVRGNANGIELGGLNASNLVSTVRINSCDVDATAGERTGFKGNGYISDLIISGGVYDGGLAGGGEGGVFINGPGCLNVSILNADISSTAPDPVTNRVLACGIGGTDGIVVRGNSFHGDGRGFTLQDVVANALIEDNYSDAEDMGFRVGHDASGAYSSDTIVYRNNTVRTQLTAGVVVGEGVTNFTMENNDIQGGDCIIRFRGAVGNASIVVQNNTLDFHPANAIAKVAALECYGMRGVSLLNNTLTSSAPITLQSLLEGALKNQGNTITGNHFTQTGGKVFDWPTANDGDNNAIDTNTYERVTGATIGDVLAATGINSLAALQAAWSGYTNPTNDANSVVIP